MSNPLNLTALFHAAQDKEREEHANAEEKKLGSLRGGNTGVVLGDGTTAGKCHRITHLRSLGHQYGTDRSRWIMFDAGIINEDNWYNKLSKSWDGPILREEEIPTRWITDSQTVVSGRPDIVLCKLDVNENSPPDRKVPVLGLELKCVSSLWTARDVLFENSPKFDHLAQAGHYMWQLNIPFKLVYTSYVDWAVLGWAQKHFPKVDDPNAVHCEYNEKGDIKKVLPFTKIYDLEWRDDGQLHYRCETEDNGWHATPVSIGGIRSYFERVSRMSDTQELGKRPATLKGHGAKANYSTCGYCELAGVCDKYEEDYDKWLAQSIKKITEINKK